VPVSPVRVIPVRVIPVRVIPVRVSAGAGRGRGGSRRAARPHQRPARMSSITSATPSSLFDAVRWGVAASTCGWALATA
jgi:hypothetical protein